MEKPEKLLCCLDRLHTTEMGKTRIGKNLSIAPESAVAFCRDAILSPRAGITRRGKNWYIEYGDAVLTVNASSLTIITAHRKK